jgi:hypothetical protein
MNDKRKNEMNERKKERKKRRRNMRKIYMSKHKVNSPGSLRVHSRLQV